MFGRPAYFFGGDNLPGVAPSDATSTAAPSSVALGEDESIVGACWNGETHLLVTSAHSDIEISVSTLKSRTNRLKSKYDTLSCGSDISA